MTTYLLDVNVVLAAHRDDHPHFPLVRPWFDDLLAGGDQFAVPMTVWASFLRLTTNRRIFTVLMAGTRVEWLPSHPVLVTVPAAGIPHVPWSC